MSIFAVLHTTTPICPRAALALAFPDQSISTQPPFRIVVPGLAVTSRTPGRPNFLLENLGLDPAVSMHFVLDKTALAPARSRLADATRSFLRATAGSVVMLYVDLPIVARRPSGAWVRRGYEDLVELEGWQVVEAVAIPRPEPADTMITADVVRTWAQQLCRAAGEVADIAQSLGLTGSLTEHGDYWDLTPPPGATRVMFVKAAAATDGIGYVDIAVAEPVPRHALDTRFGWGQLLPPVHPGRPYQVAYHVTVPGARYTCEVIAAFNDEPTTPATSAHGVVLRRDRSSEP